MAERRITVITGGASGIGRATADRVARDGHHIVVLDVNAEGAETAAEELRAGDAVADALALNVADDQAVEDVFDRIETEIGAVHGVVHAAGVLQNAITAERMDRAEENL